MYIFNSNNTNINLHLARYTGRYGNRLRHNPAVFHQLQLMLFVFFHKCKFHYRLVTQLWCSSLRLHWYPWNRTRPWSLLWCKNRRRIHTGSQSCLHRGLEILDNLCIGNTECWRLLGYWRRKQIKATNPKRQRFKITQSHTIFIVVSPTITGHFGSWAGLGKGSHMISYRYFVSPTFSKSSIFNFFCPH